MLVIMSVPGFTGIADFQGKGDSGTNHDIAVLIPLETA